MVALFRCAGWRLCTGRIAVGRNAREFGGCGGHVSIAPDASKIVQEGKHALPAGERSYGAPVGPRRKRYEDGADAHDPGHRLQEVNGGWTAEGEVAEHVADDRHRIDLRERLQPTRHG